jgi:hypothetical protein
MSYCFVLQAALDCLALTLDYEMFQKSDVTDLESLPKQQLTIQGSGF